MIAIISGTRTFTDYDLMKERLDYFFSKKQPTKIITGSPILEIFPEEHKTKMKGTYWTYFKTRDTGADELAKRYCEERNISYQNYPADWNKFKKAAGPIRNGEMEKVATHLIAFWDGKSRGTKDMIDKMEMVNKPFKVVKY